LELAAVALKLRAPSVSTWIRSIKFCGIGENAEQPKAACRVADHDLERPGLLKCESGALFAKR
jgi:hypothetical protein